MSLENIIPIAEAITDGIATCRHSRQIDPATVFLAPAAMTHSEKRTFPNCTGLVLVGRRLDDAAILDDSALAGPELAGDAALTIALRDVWHWIAPVGLA